MSNIGADHGAGVDGVRTDWCNATIAAGKKIEIDRLRRRRFSEMRFQAKPLVFSGDVELRQPRPASGGIDDGAGGIGFFGCDNVKEVIAPHFADRNAFLNVDSTVLRRVKERG